MIVMGFKGGLLDWGNFVRIEGEMGLKGFSAVFKTWRIFLIRREDFWLVPLFSFYFIALQRHLIKVERREKILCMRS